MQIEAPLLEVKGLTKHFPIIAGFLRRRVGEVRAVENVDLSIHCGAVLGLVGESGSGKSTVGRCIMGLIEPTAGEILFEGKKIAGLSKSYCRDVQIVFQDPYASLNPRKTILESIGEPLIYHGIVEKKQELESAVADILRRVGLAPDAMRRHPHAFSGGQQQRICIGRAIGLRPKLLICDEVVSALDVSIQAQILNLLLELKEDGGFSCLFISHNLAVVRYIANHVAVMHQGKIVEQGAIEQVFTHPAEDYTKTLLKAIPADHPASASKLRD